MMLDLFHTDRERWNMYYDLGYTPDENIANYGD